MSVTLSTEPRDKVGSRDARKLRAAGRIPCALQGADAPCSFSIDADAFFAARRSHEHLFDLDLGGKEPQAAVVRELQWHYLSDSILHVDFQAVTRGVAVATEVALHFTGTPKGGILNALVETLTVESLPSEIPDEIEFLVTALDEGSHLSAGDIKLPAGVTLAMDPETPVAVVSGASSVEDGVEAEETEGDDEDLGKGTTLVEGDDA